MTSDPRFAAVPLLEVFPSLAYSKAIHRRDLRQEGEARFPYVSRTSRGNGIAVWVPRQAQEPNPGNRVSVGLDTMTVFYQPVDFYTGRDIIVLASPKLTPENGLLLVQIIRNQIAGLSWGNGASLKRMGRATLMMPTDGSKVDWEWMNATGTALMRERTSMVTAPDTQASAMARPLLFEARLVTEVFDDILASTAWLDGVRIDSTGEPRYPYISRSGENNGVSRHIPRQPGMEPNPGNVIAVGLDTQTATYQPVPFYTGQNIQVLASQHLNEHNALMLIPMLRRQLVKFSWGGSGATLGRLRRTRMMVPVVDSGDVDWEGMTAHGQKLSARLAGATEDGLAWRGSD